RGAAAAARGDAGRPGYGAGRADRRWRPRRGNVPGEPVGARRSGATLSGDWRARRARGARDGDVHAWRRLTMRWRRLARVLLLVCVSAAAASTASAEPRFLSKQYTRCTACHVIPSGGGLLTDYGRSLSHRELSTTGDRGGTSP